ncbi:McrC family protein [Halomonas denitrificans]|nr:McrC family protein [Halomonas denitrificans]
MTSGSPHTVYEFGHLVCGCSSPPAVTISDEAFNYLERLALSQDPGANSLLRLCSYRGQKALQVRNYVGVLQTPDGSQIEILPKVCSDGEIEARQSLLNMLRHLRAFRHIQSVDSQVAVSNMPLLEIFISQFLDSVNHLIKRGLRSEYTSRQDNQTFMKGRLLAAKQLQHNLINRHHFYVEYDEYRQDTPANRLIHTALQKVSGYARLNANQRLCRELKFAFAEIPLSRHPKQDFDNVQRARGMAYYPQPLAWARLILDGVTPLSMKGNANAFSLLFPMESVFESYVASVLKQQIKPPFKLLEQAHSVSLVRFNQADWFRLKPDLMLYHQDKPVVILDTKWKLLDASKGNGVDKFGLSQADFYQMFAYGQKYLEGQGNLVLIYPKTAQFSRPIEHSFGFSDSLRLWVVPFDITSSTPDRDRLQLAENSKAYFDSMVPI